MNVTDVMAKINKMCLLQIDTTTQASLELLSIYITLQIENTIPTKTANINISVLREELQSGNYMNIYMQFM